MAQQKAFDSQTLVKDMLAEFDCKTSEELLAKAIDVIGTSGITGIVGNERVRQLAARLLENHKFEKVDPKTGRIIDGVVSSSAWQLGGTDNALNELGKIVLDNILTKKFQRKVSKWVSPNPKLLSFGLDFHKERQKCLQKKVLFEDPEFPAKIWTICREPMSETHRDILNKIEDEDGGEVVWMRPTELVKDPQFIAQDSSRFDVLQGMLGDCWLLASVANLTQRDELFYRVVPPDQSFTENYAGIFHFQFWLYGKWVDVVVDDRLPVFKKDDKCKLLFVHSPQKNEFWVPLLEKAFAKLYGSYEAITGGFASEAFEDFTGGVAEYFYLSDVPREALVVLLLRALQMDSMISCGTGWHFDDNGIASGHQYSVTGLQVVETTEGKVLLIRVRNPWSGDETRETEWNGRWSDASEEWKKVSDDERKRIDARYSKDGEFWMCIEDFQNIFLDMDICHVGPDVLSEVKDMTGGKCATECWQMAAVRGRWPKNGIPKEDVSLALASNPQYVVHVELTEATSHSTSIVLVALMQEHQRERNLPMSAIDFAVFPCDSPTAKVNREFFEKTECITKAETDNSQTREVAKRFYAPPGDYLVVPCVNADDEDFLLRTFANGPITIRELKANEEQRS